MSSTKTRDRRLAILGIVRNEIASVEQLSLHFGVSESTIRRDLAHLVESGLIVRTYGGAALLAEDKREHSLDERQSTRRNEKEAIARVAATYVHGMQTIILDAGTTTGALARQLKGRQDLTVVTTNILALTSLSKEKGIALTMLGGSVRKMSLSVVGPLTEMALNRITADKVFLGADGLVAGRGLCEASQEQASLKEKMMERASDIFVLADASKLGYAGQNAWSPMVRPWTLITDATATTEQLKPFHDLPEVTIVIADDHADPARAH